MKRKVFHQIENTGTYEFCTDGVTCADKEGENEGAAPHFHRNFEFLLMKKGECHLEIGDEQYHMREGEMAVIMPFQMHAFCVFPHSEVRRISFHNHLILSLATALSEKKPEFAVFRPSDTVWQFFFDRMRELFGTQPQKIHRIPEKERIMVKGCLYALGGEVLHQVPMVPARNADALMLDVVQYIADNFQKNISLQDIAKEKGYSYHYLSRIFNRTFSVSFKDMLNQYRMEYAYCLLQDTRLPIAEIAFESGFQSVRSFDYICRLYHGKSPRELRGDHYI